MKNTQAETAAIAMLARKHDMPAANLAIDVQQNRLGAWNGTLSYTIRSSGGMFFKSESLAAAYGENRLDMLMCLIWSAGADASLIDSRIQSARKLLQPAD